eukprot:c22017_g1_i4.p1 GENE.c22017_g1_i4~~c22017_g1_i4.p1  ORF type:complete len:471 (-),score=163.11 c22017_g1_i4:1407-2819(-)
MGSGGAIEIDYGVFNITNTNFTNNFATNTGGAVTVRGLDDGTIYLVEFIDNLSKVGGGIYIETVSVLMYSTKFISNSAFENGGGLFAQHLPVQTNMTNIIFDSNTAKNFGGGAYISGGRGSLTKLEFLNNFGVQHGGGLAAINCDFSQFTDIQFINNKANYLGGGLYLDSSPLTLKFILFSSNYAAYGGGIAEFQTLKNLISFSDSIFENNIAETAAGAGMFSDSLISMTNITVSNNSAPHSGGMLVTRSPLTIENSRFINNQATESDGGAIIASSVLVFNVIKSVFQSNHAFRRGGGILISSLYEVSNCTLSKTIFNDNSGKIGGALYIDESNWQFNNLNFSRNFAQTDGGAIFSNTAGTLTKAFFSENYAFDRGGGIYLDHTKSMSFLEKINCKNNSAYIGACVAGTFSPINVVNSVFELNQAETFGGSISLNSSSFSTFRLNKFTNNTVKSGDGGAIYFQNSFNITF